MNDAHPSTGGHPGLLILSMLVSVGIFISSQILHSQRYSSAQKSVQSSSPSFATGTGDWETVSEDCGTSDAWVSVTRQLDAAMDGLEDTECRLQEVIQRQQSLEIRVNLDAIESAVHAAVSTSSAGDGRKR